MSLPTFKLEVAFTPNTPYDLAPTFSDLSGDLTSLSVARGRATEDDTAATGQCRSSLLDTTRAYDPNNAAGPHWPNILPIRPLRVTATLDAVTYPVFYGWVDLNDGWVRSEQDKGAAEVSVPANDGFEPLTSGRLFANQFRTTLLGMTPQLYWRLGDAVGSGTAADSSGNGHTGTVTRGVFGQNGALVGDADTSIILYGGSGFLPARNAFIQAGGYAPFVTASQRTFTFWFNRDGTTAGGLGWMSGSLGTGLSLNTTSAGDITFSPRGGTTLTWAGALNGVPIGAWGLLALTYDDNTKIAELFINGASLGAQTAALGYNTPGEFIIGPTSNLHNDNTYFDEVAVFNAILTGAQIASLYTNGSPTAGASFVSELTGVRIGHALDAADPSWPTVWRALDAGQETMASNNAASSVTPLAAIRDGETTEPGFFFFSRDGYAHFHDRRHRLLATSQATFCDVPNQGAGRILYDSITTRRTTVVNDVRATAPGGTEQVVSDTPSTNSFFRRVLSVATQHVSNAAALAFAQFVLSLKKDSYELIESLTLVPGTDSTVWAQVLGREVGDRITVVRTPPGGGSAITQDYFIEAVALDWGPGPTAKCVWRLSSSGAQFNYWLAGTAGSSEAGTTTKAAY